jgi:hypothetical protein
MGDAEEPLAKRAAAQRVFHNLSHRLAQVVTPAGSEALLKRAVHLSRATFPFLAGVQTAPSTASLLDRLLEAAANVEPSQAHEGFVMVLETLVALLESFIGEDLAFRLLRDIGPEPPTTPSTPPVAGQ